MNEKHEAIKKYIEAVASGVSNSLIVLGKPGIGKTETTLNKMQEAGYQEGIHYRYITNYVAPLSLFKLLQEVNLLQEPKILILDDAEAIFKHRETAGILRSALWEAPNGERKVAWISGTHQLKGYAKEYNFTGRIILLLNELNTKSPILEALADRALFYHFTLSPTEINELIKRRAAEWNDSMIPRQKRIEIAEYVVKNGGENKSLRSLRKAFQLFAISPNHWRELLQKIT